ncbi:hypothetical protein PENTCL1PPCAC_3171 [Pristionchus entomophagus]|uniref:Uncharacterized protein n=1 Tax=Pristionchus entomophagus TaxID=358040 RepID=A0AAV5SCB8_9BILA|nr:hypothetical protein PENTCL1PPCAC_3171 [Pristionchus entomophagus]
MADKFVGTWVCSQSENVEAYFKEVGASHHLIKELSHMKGTLTFEIDGDEWTMTFHSPLKSHTYTFRLGQEFNDTALDGRDVTSRFEFDGTTLVEFERGMHGGKDSRKEMTISGNTLTEVDQCQNLKSTSVYQKARPGLVAAF